MPKKETILVFGAHSDDFVIGAGGTILNYAKEGKRVISVVFSYGEKSHPWIKERIIKTLRSKEAFEASKILKCKTIFFDLKEFNFLDQVKNKEIEEQLLKIINKNKPSKIFTHGNEDPHPDHQSVFKITLQLFEKIDYLPKPSLYTYSIWNPVSFSSNYPALYLDISKTFWTKLKALMVFKSQRLHLIYPFILLVIRSIHYGIKIKKKAAEKFYRIK